MAICSSALGDTLYIIEIPFTLWQAKNFAYKSSVIPLYGIDDRETFFALPGWLRVLPE